MTLGLEFAYENKNLQPTFVGESHSVGFWAAISYGHHAFRHRLHRVDTILTATNVTTQTDLSLRDPP
jgi:hypothetical protein